MKTARLIGCLSAALLAALTALPAGAAVGYAVGSPWIASLTSFIGGTNVDARVIGGWDAAGRPSALSRPRKGEIIIALDSAEAAALRINKETPGLRLLYDNILLPAEQKYSVFFDPAMLPFVAQSIMKILAETDNQRYAFYQRRLAEFQSRLDSTVEIGRYMLEDKKLLDLTGAQGAWVRAAMPGAVRPPEDVWKKWLEGDAESLDAALAEADRRDWLLLLDNWTPSVIRAAAISHANRLTLVPPAMDQDCFSFLHDIFISVSAKAN